jgi:formate/nitrite transporter
LSRKSDEIADLLCSQYSTKTKAPTHKVLLLAILAGAYVGFGGYLYLVVSSDAAAYIGHGLAAIMGGLVFSLGLILIVVAGGELFTGNGLLTLSCLSGKTRWVDALKNWVIVYFGNLIGSMLLVGLIFVGGSYLTSGGEVAARILQVSSSKVGLSFGEALIRGLLCNWLVCLAVWLAYSATDTGGKIIAIIFPISAFVAMGFEHSVANMFLIPLGILVSSDPLLVAQVGVETSKLNVTGLLENLIPVTIGNLIGGAVFVAAAYWYIYLKDAK